MRISTFAIAVLLLPVCGIPSYSQSVSTDQTSKPIPPESRLVKKVFDFNFQGDIVNCLPILRSAQPDVTVMPSTGWATPILINVDLKATTFEEALREISEQAGEAADVLWDKSANNGKGQISIRFRAIDSKSGKLEKLVDKTINSENEKSIPVQLTSSKELKSPVKQIAIDSGNIQKPTEQLSSNDAQSRKPNISQEWSLGDNKTLRDLISQWSNKNGTTLQWQSSFDYIIPARIRDKKFIGTFKEVLTQLSQTYGEFSGPLIITLSDNDNKLIVRDKKVS